MAVQSGRGILSIFSISTDSNSNVRATEKELGQPKSSFRRGPGFGICRAIAETTAKSRRSIDQASLFRNGGLIAHGYE
jgi:hypothetical protein